MFCPHCGFKNDKNSNFCKRCGFNLAKYKQQNNIDKENTNPNPRPTRVQREQQPRPMQPIQQQPRHHSIRGIVITVIVLLLFIGLGFGAYHIEHGDNGGPVDTIGEKAKENNDAATRSESPSAAKKDITSQIDTLWANVQLKANGGNGSLSKFFTTGTSNYGYKQLEEWSKDQSKASGLSRVIVNPSDEKGHVNGNGNKAVVKYKVSYKFEYNDGSSKNQAFMWTAHLTENDGNWLISSNNSSNKPVSND